MVWLGGNDRSVASSRSMKREIDRAKPIGFDVIGYSPVLCVKLGAYWLRQTNPISPGADARESQGEAGASGSERSGKRSAADSTDHVHPRSSTRPGFPA